VNIIIYFFYFNGGKGVRNEISFDGIWSKSSENLIIEVKTTVAYSIDLETAIRYRLDSLVLNLNNGVEIDMEEFLIN